MKKIIIQLMVSLFLLVGLPFLVQAGDDSIDDQTGLFSPEEINRLKEEITPIEKEAKARIFIFTDALNEINSQENADNFMLHKIGRSQNGVTFYIDMKQRNFVISTSGNMIDYLNDERIEAMLDVIEKSMIEGNYMQAAETFLQNVNSYFKEGVPGGHYRIDTETGKITRYKTLTGAKIVTALITAIVLSIIYFVVNIFKYNLKFGKYKYPFKEKSTLQLTIKNDHLINSFITTRQISKNKSGWGGHSGKGGGSSTHSTGGGTFGGGGRKF